MERMNEKKLALIEFEAEGIIPMFTRNKRLARELAMKKLGDIAGFDEVEIERIKRANGWWMMVDFRVEGSTQIVGSEKAEVIFYAKENIEVDFKREFNNWSALEIIDIEIVDWEGI